MALVNFIELAVLQVGFDPAIDPTLQCHLVLAQAHPIWERLHDKLNFNVARRICFFHGGNHAGCRGEVILLTGGNGCIGRGVVFVAYNRDICNFLGASRQFLVTGRSPGDSNILTSEVAKALERERFGSGYDDGYNTVRL